MKPITACVVSINSCIPVGIRLTGYDPINCEEKGFFIHVNPIEWEWVNQDDAREVNDPKTLVEQYSYKKEYFLVEWLERFGFEALLSILNVDKEGNFYIKGHNFFFNRIANLIDTITKME